VRFETSSELRLFADSVRGALAGWEPPREPAFGTWWDEHDEELAVQLRELGWAELWSDEELIGAAVAGGFELGRAVAPLSLVDEPTLGGALCVGGRARHVTDRYKVALVTGQGVVLTGIDEGVQEPTLDGTGTVRGEAPGVAEALVDSNARLRLWGVTSLAYLAGLARASFDTTVAFVTSREQFGAPLSSLPTMQARLADAALAVDGLELLAWEAAAEDSLPRESLAWAGAAAREVTASAHQAHGAVGFALESGVHVAYRRAKSSQVWIAAVLAATSRH
jgi:alkylation response protein AidB-like acyl-CoA dehydrogenase